MKRLLAVLAVVFGLLMLAPPASAQIPGMGDCKTPPTAEWPGDGADAGFGDPSAQQRHGASLWDQYGTAGMRFWRYDTGCTPSLDDASNATWNSLGDFVFGLARVTVSTTDAVLRLRDDPALMFRAVDPAVASATSALQRAVWSPWVAVPGLLVAAYIMVKAHKGDVDESWKATLGVLIVLLVVGALGTQPLRWAQSFDGTIATANRSIHQALNGTGDPASSASTSLHDAALYQTWLSAVFGSADNAAAREYGLRTLQATAVTKQEAARVGNDPERRQELLDQKADEFGELAEEVKEDYPDLYLRHFTGQDANPRVMKASLGAFTAAVGSLFLVVSTFLVLLALLIVRVAIVCSPVVGLLALYRPTGWVGKNTVVMVGMALLNAFAFVVASAFVIRFMGLVLGSSMWPTAKLLLLILLGVVGWRASKQFTKLNQRPTIAGVKKSATSGPAHKPAELEQWRADGKPDRKKAVAQAAGTAVGGAAGGAAAAAVAGATGTGQHQAKPPTSWTTPVQPTPNPAYVPPSGTQSVPPVYNVTTVGQPQQTPVGTPSLGSGR